MSSLVDFVVFCCHSVHIHVLSESKPLHDDSFLRKIFSLLAFVFNNIPLTKMNELLFFLYTTNK